MASITAGGVLGRLTCPLPALNLRGTSVPVGRVNAPPGRGLLPVGTARLVRPATNNGSLASFRRHALSPTRTLQLKIRSGAA